MRALCYVKQTEKDKYNMISLIYGIWKKTKMKWNEVKNKEKTKFVDTGNRLIGGGWGVDETGEGSQKVKISHYKINNPWICTVQHGDYT